MQHATGTPRVAFNLMSARVGGGLTYAVAQTRAFLKIWPHDKIVLLTSPWNDDALSQALDHPTIRLPARSALHRYLIEQTLPLGLLRKERIDVLYGIGNFLPLTPTSCRAVMTLQNPNYVGEGRRLSHNKTISERLRLELSYASMKRADLVVTISRSLDAALRTEKRLKKIRTRVILSGGPDWSTVEADGTLSSSIGLEPFILSVANDYSHKRLDDIAQALAISSAGTVRPMNIVFVGSITRQRQSALRLKAASAGSRLVFLDSIGERAQIKWLYENAWAAVSASELEAFPLTPAEAACLRCPLILSDIPPHLEVAKGAGTYFKQGDVTALAEQLRKVAATDERQPASPWEWPSTWSDNAGELAGSLREVCNR